MCPRRGSSAEGSHVTDRVVNQLLTEMDGLEQRRQVFVIAATNRPDIIEPAMLRPGRLERLLYVKLPDAEERHQILLKHIRKSPIAQDVNIREIAEDSRAQGYSGADVAALVREATVQALREAAMKHISALSQPGVELPSDIAVGVQVQRRHFDAAFRKVLPSVSETSRRRYDRMHQQLSAARSQLRADDESEQAKQEQS